MTAPKTKPYTVLTVVESESGSWSYEIRISHRTGETYCTCRGWTFHKTCKHLDAYKAQPVFVPTPKGMETPSEKVMPMRQQLIDKLRSFGVRSLTDVQVNQILLIFDTGRPAGGIVTQHVRRIVLPD